MKFTVRIPGLPGQFEKGKIVLVGGHPHKVLEAEWDDESTDVDKDGNRYPGMWQLTLERSEEGRH